MEDTEELTSQRHHATKITLSRLSNHTHQESRYVLRAAAASLPRAVTRPHCEANSGCRIVPLFFLPERIHSLSLRLAVMDADAKMIHLQGETRVKR